MIWTDFKVDKLKQLCYSGKGNREIAKLLECNLTEVYAKRSQLGITIAKCKGVAPNQKFDECKGMAPNAEFEKALAPITPKHKKGLTRDVRKAFKDLGTEVLLAMASNWTSVEDARVYEALGNALDDLEASYNKLIGC